MNQLVILTQNNEAVTTSLAIAEGTEVEHASVILLVRNYISDLEEFGNVDFKSTLNPGQKRATEYAILNEDQATLLITYMRNSEVVRNFKKRLVKEFRAMHNALQSQVPQSFSEALMLAANLQAEKERLLVETKQQQEKILQDQPKVTYVDELIQAEERLSIRNVAKTLHLKETEFRKWLVWAGELLDAGKYVANRYSASAEAARKHHMDHKRSKPHTTEDGEVFQAITPYFTDLGVMHVKARLQKFKTTYPDKFAVAFRDSIEDARKAQIKEAKFKEFSVL